MFTPMSEALTERLKFEDHQVKTTDGDWRERGLGNKAIVVIGGGHELTGKHYLVRGLSCGAPGCDCDAQLIDITI